MVTPPSGALEDMAALKEREKATVLRVPPAICSVVKKFLLDGHTGNIILNVKDGRILGCKVEQIVSVKA